MSMAAFSKAITVPFRRPKLFVAGSVSLATIIAGSGIWALVQMRSDALERAREGASNLSVILERNIASGLGAYELSMQAVIDGVNNPRILSLPPDVRQLVLFDRSINTQDVGSLLATDERGDVILDSRLTPPRPANLADRDFFQVHRASRATGPYVSRPFQPRLTDGGQSIGISRRLSHADGTFAGIVVGTLRVNYFHRLFNGVRLGPGGSITLLRNDGVVLMRRPFDEDSIGRRIADSPSFPPLIQARSGSYVGTAALDGVERLYDFRYIADLPLIVVVGLSTHDVFAEWRKRAWEFGLVIVMLGYPCGAVCAGVAPTYGDGRAPARDG